MYSPQQFSNIPPPSSISNIYQGPPQQQPFSHQNVINNSAQISVGGQSQNQASPLNSTAGYASGPQLQTYSSFPQIGGAGAVQTPISLPGMPPITVSTTIPPQQFEAMQFNPMVSHHN